MSQRGKRPNRLDGGGDETTATGGGGGGGGGPPSKRRKGRPAKANASNAASASGHSGNGNGGGGPSGAGGGDGGDDSGETASWQPRNDIKSSIYNSSAPEAPSELFRKDLISAMKLPDSEPLALDEYWMISDQWKQEWERGVQVPVNPDSLPEPSVSSKLHDSFYTGRQDFKLPKHKFIRITKDDTFSSELHYLSNAPAMADAACAYDMDQTDVAWLGILNGERAMTGLQPVSDEQFERVVEELEVRCWDKIHAIMKDEEGLGIEYDENVICDVCRSPDSEEANEMVFCDSCNICVHQACYGITAIPSGSWLCRTCSMAKRPDCVLCPNKGGAMKSTRTGQKWAHVSCALWIPEVSIGSVDRMEPITKITSIPQSRWALVCVLCRERVGACIQCSVKTCKTAYHVTCAFQHGLEMRAIIEDELAEDGVKLRSYCLKHSMNKNKKDKSHSANNNGAGGGSGESEEDDHKRKKHRKDMTSEERNIARMKRMHEVEAEFDKHVNVRDISCHLLEVDQEAIHCIHNFWILKRKAQHNRSLLPQKPEDVDMIAHKQEPADIEKMKMFVHLRQDLERVRNLCYMVSRREKLSRSFFKLREQTFHKQVAVLSEEGVVRKLDAKVISAIVQANHGPSVYDRLYSNEKCFSAAVQAGCSLEQVLSRLLGKDGQQKQSPKSNSRKASASTTAAAAAAADLNGLTTNTAKGKKSRTRLISHSPDRKPRNKSYLNGATATQSLTAGAAALRALADSIYSSLSSEDTDEMIVPSATTKRTSHVRHSSTNEDDDDSATDDRRKSRTTHSASIPTTPTSSSAANKKKLTAAQRALLTASGGAKPGTDAKFDRRKQRRVSSAVTTNTTPKSSSMSTSKPLVLDTSSDEEAVEKRSPRNRMLRQMELDLEMAKYKVSGSESDELIAIRPAKLDQKAGATENKKMLAIYSDSDSTDKDKTDNTASDSQQHPFRTKAAMKEFNMHAGKAADASSSTKVIGSSKPGEGSSAGKDTAKESHPASSADPVDRLGKEKHTSKDQELGERLKDVLKSDHQRQAHENNQTKPSDSDKPKAQAKNTKLEDKKQRDQAAIEKLSQSSDPAKDKFASNSSSSSAFNRDKIGHDKTAAKVSRGFAPTDLLVVPQRKAAKKASENMMRTTVPSKKEQQREEESSFKDIAPSRGTVSVRKDLEKEVSEQRAETTPNKSSSAVSKESPTVANKSEQPSPVAATTTKPGRGRPSNSAKTAMAVAAAAAAAAALALLPKSTKDSTSSSESRITPSTSSSTTSDTSSTSNNKPDKPPIKPSAAVKSSKDKTDKESQFVAYVPQRQAAKKAAEHIKSGLGKPASDAPATATNSRSNSSDEKLKPAATKRDDKKASTTTTILSSGASSGSDSSSNSSSNSSSSSSSSDSEEEEEEASKKTTTTTTTTTTTAVAKGDKAKELPFLNKVPKSVGSASSSGSSSSDSDSSANSSDDSSDEPVSNIKPNSKQPPNNNSRPAKQQQQPNKVQPIISPKKPQPRRDSEKKLKTSELDRTGVAKLAADGSAHTKPSPASASNSSKGEESQPPSASAEATLSPPPAKPRPVGRAAGKRQSISADRRRSVDARSGNLAKAAKADAVKSTPSTTAVPASPVTSPKPGQDISALTSPKRPAPSDGARKRKSSVSVEDISKPTDKPSSDPLPSVSPNKPTAKESSQPRELPAAQRKTNEKLGTNELARPWETTTTSSSNPPETLSDPVGSLEKEISERKASSNHRSTKSSSLDKLLSKREKDVMKAKQVSPVKEAESKSDVVQVIDLAKSEAEIKPEAPKVLLAGDVIEIIDIDDDSKEEKMNVESIAVHEKISEEVPKVEEKDEKMDVSGKSTAEANNSFTFSDDGGKIEGALKSPDTIAAASLSATPSEMELQKSLFSPQPQLTSEKSDTSIFNFDKDFSTADDPFTIGSTPSDVSGPISFTFPTENLFKQDFKEDSAKETMDLVGKLRQKIKKTGQAIRNEVPPIIAVDSSPDESMESNAVEKSVGSTEKEVGAKQTEEATTAHPDRTPNLVESDNNGRVEMIKSQESITSTRQQISAWDNIGRITPPPPTLPDAMQQQEQLHQQQLVNLINQQNHPLNLPTSEAASAQQQLHHHHHDDVASQMPVFTEEQQQNLANLMNLHDPTNAAAQDFIRHIQEQAKLQPEQSLDQITSLLSKSNKFMPNDHQMGSLHVPLATSIAIRHHDSADENDHSPRMRTANKWTDSDMIQTRRSVSSSPSSASESNVDEHLDLQRQQQQQQQLQQHHQQLQQQQQQQQQYQMQQHQQQFQHMQSLHMQPQQQQHQQLIHQNLPYQHLMQQHSQQSSQQHDIRTAHMRKMNDIAFTNMHPDMQAFAVPPQQQQSLADQMSNSFNFNNDHSNTFNQGVGPVSLFPPTSHNVQLPFPSPGAAMFPPNFANQSFGGQQPNNTTTTATTSINNPLHQQQQQQQQHHLNLDQQQTQQQQQQTLLHQSHSPLVVAASKMDTAMHHHPSAPNQLSYPSNPCGAAFTSSLHNMALTEAIVAPQSSMLNNNNNTQQPLDNNNLNQTTQQQQQHHSLLQHRQNAVIENHSTGLVQQNNATAADDRLRDSCYQATNAQQHLAAAHAVEAAALTANNNAAKLNALENESPAKPNKRSTRIVAQQAAQIITQQLTRSPSKSPSKSPRSDISRHTAMSSGRGRGESTRGRKNAARGTGNPRGRPRGSRGRPRGSGVTHQSVANLVPHQHPMTHMQMHHQHMQQSHANIQGMGEYDGYRQGANHSKYTVYDFDDDFAGENVENLKAMRDRRRSVDCRQDQFRGSRDASESPKFSGHHKGVSRMGQFGAGDMRDLRPPTPVRRDSLGGPNANNSTPSSQQHLPSPVGTSIRSIVSPVLPGPVDMRTYNSGYDNDTYNNSSLLGVFATGTADQTLQPIDEELEKALQSALKASNSKPSAIAAPTLDTLTSMEPNLGDPNALLQNTTIPPALPPMIPIVEVPTSDDISIDSADTIPHSKMSLFKLKIKGPHAHPDNYISSVAQSNHHSEAPPSHLATNIPTAIPPSNLRRMRKKELLRQYCNQDMNNDLDTNCAGLLPGAEFSEPVAHQFAYNHQTVGRSSGGIPKAVDSMSSIPTKDDYKDYSDYTPKKRKTMNRELRQLDIPFDADSITERRRSVGSNASSNSTNTSADVTKRMTRTKQQAATMATPKLKIKIGANSTEATITSDRPPKKRLANMVPSFEDLKRESMNYRKQVMGEFDDADEDTTGGAAAVPAKRAKVKKNKVSKSERKEEKREEKRKRKLEKRMNMQIIGGVEMGEMPVVAPESGATGDAKPKLIIRIGKRKADDGPDNGSGGGGGGGGCGGDPSSVMATSGASSTNTSPGSGGGFVPIRLKIARSSQGSSYVAIGDRKDADEKTGPAGGTGTSGKQLGEGDEEAMNRTQTTPGSVEGVLDPTHPRLNPTVVVSDVMAMSQKLGTDPANNNLHPNAPVIQNDILDVPNKTVPPSTGDSQLTGPPTVDPKTVPLTTQAAAASIVDDDGPKDQSPSQKASPLLPPLSKDCEVR